MEKIFWVACPKCLRRFYVDFALRYAKVHLICPFCQVKFAVSESSDIDDRVAST